MTRHFNPSITNRASRILNSKQGDFLSDNVQGPIATIAIVPRADLLKVLIKSTSTAGNIFTAATDKDTYITGIELAYTKDATCDVSTGMTGISFIVDGATISVVYLPVTTLTAETKEIYIPFSVPVKIDRGSAVALANNQTFSVGAFSRGAIVHGYTEEVTK